MSLDLEELLSFDRELQKILDEEDRMQFLLLCKIKRFKSPSFYRERWNCEYLRNLAVQEGSFVAEYRLDPGGFDELVSILEPHLQVKSFFFTYYHFSKKW